MLRAFTLLEVLVAISIIAILLSLLTVALGRARGEMKKLHCSSNLHSAAFHFQLFAEGQTEDGQGDSERLGVAQFYANDFQESLYGIDEFWNLGSAATGEVGGASELMVCPAGPGPLTKRVGFPCSQEAVGPAADVSIAMNMRLYRRSYNRAGRTLLLPVAATRIPRSVLNHPYVPLVLDVDGKAAMLRGLEPYYTAPSLPHVDDPYSGGRFWMPSLRHGGRTNVAFVGGHVLSTTDASAEGWNWDYQAKGGR